jgi:hypothetical protein
MRWRRRGNALKPVKDNTAVLDPSEQFHKVLQIFMRYQAKL